MYNSLEHDKTAVKNKMLPTAASLLGTWEEPLADCKGRTIV